MSKAWEDYSYNFDAYEIAEDDTATAAQLEERISQIVDKEKEPALYDFLTRGGVYIRPLEENNAYEYFTCRIDDEGNICLSEDIIRLSDFSQAELAGYANEQGVCMREFYERGGNSISYIMEQAPMAYFSNIPNHTNELINRLHDKGLFTQDFYHKDIEIYEEADDSQSPYLFYLKERGSDIEQFTDFYVDTDGNIIGSDDVLDLIKYCEVNELHRIDQSTDYLISLNMDALGPNLRGIVYQVFNNMPESISGRVESSYLSMIAEYREAAIDNKSAIEDDISAFWYFNPDYREAPEQYFDYIIKLGENFIRYNFENKFAYDIAYAYLDEYGKNEGVYYEIVEDTYEYNNGLMLILYDISIDEARNVQGKNKSEINETHFSIDIDNIHNGGIPKEFFDKIYNISTEFSKIKEKQTEEERQ